MAIKEDYSLGAPYNQQQTAGVRELKKNYHAKNILPLLRQCFSSDDELHILEFGPGLGIMADLIYHEFPRVNYSAVDIDSSILRRIEQSHPGSRVAQITNASELELFLAGEKYDAVIALDVWEHLPSEELRPYTAQCLTHLKRNGLLIIQVPNWGCPFCSGVTFAGDITHCNPFNEISARQLLLNCGASAEQITILPYRLPPGLINRVRDVCRRGLFLLYRLLLGTIGIQVLKVCTPNLIISVKNTSREEVGS